MGLLLCNIFIQTTMSSTQKFALKQIDNLIESVDRAAGSSNVVESLSDCDYRRSFAIGWPATEAALNASIQLTDQDHTRVMLINQRNNGRNIAHNILHPPMVNSEPNPLAERVAELEALVSRQRDALSDREGMIHDRDTKIDALQKQYFEFLNNSKKQAAKKASRKASTAKSKSKR